MTIVKLTGAALALTLAIFAGPALAIGHLHDAAHSEGADNREVAANGARFHNPVVDNPSGVSGAAADPMSVPSTGNPNTGHGS